MGAYGAIIGGVVGGAMGASKKGNDFNDANTDNYSQDLLSSQQAYKNLVNQGPGATDVANALSASKDYASALQNASQTGGFNMRRGNELAQQQFGGQRVAMEQSFQDQLAQANRAAALSGRGSNDPILRARLAQDQTRQQALLQSNQSAAAVNLGLQYTQNSLGLQGQQVGVLQGLSQQAFGNQQNLFSMTSAAYDSEFNKTMSKLGYENSRGGGAAGIFQGAASGAAAGSSFGAGGGGLSAFNSSYQGGGDAGAGGGGGYSLGANTSFGGLGNGGSGVGSAGSSPAVQNFAPQASYPGVSAPSMVSPYSGSYAVGVSAPAYVPAYNGGASSSLGANSFSYK